jgi:hypothetical protein
MYGTVMIAKLNGSLEDLRQIGKEWEAEHPVKGYVGQDIMLGDDGETVVSVVRFTSKTEYQALADDPTQDEWWRTKMEPLLSDVQWIDGEWELGAR